MLKAPNNRHGITLEPQAASVSLSDIQDIFHIGVSSSISSPWESASGGVSRVEKNAKLAAIGESIERYSAALIKTPLKRSSQIPADKRIDANEWCLFTDKQVNTPGFPFENIYSDRCLYTNVFDFQNNDELWIPQPLVVLRDDYQTGLPTSSGLAAGPTLKHALLRSILELIERDALMVTWMHSLPGRSIELPSDLVKQVENLQGEVWAFDLTPEYSPFPVIAVAGGIPKRGIWRYSLGVACKETLELALDKAFLEWNQGILFAGIYDKHIDTSNINNPYTLKSFEEHAIYYTLHPDQWLNLPLLRERNDIQKPYQEGNEVSTEQALENLKESFDKNNIRMFYRNITTIDAEQLGVKVVRAASPDLASIFAHQEWPLLNNLEKRLEACYPWAVDKAEFPNLMPHPLG